MSATPLFTASSGWSLPRHVEASSALFDGPTFDKATLPPLPAGVDGFTVASISPSQLFDKFLAIVRQNCPNGDQQVNAMHGQINQMLGVKLQRGSARQARPEMVDVRGLDLAAPAPELAACRSTLVALTDLADPAKFAGSLGKVLEVANNQISRPTVRPNCRQRRSDARSSRSSPARNSATSWSCRPARSLRPDVRASSRRS